MTIAIGLISTGGLVFAADTQDGIPGWMKTRQTKLDLDCWGDGGHCLVAGAGTSAYIDSAAQRLHQAFKVAQPKPDEYQYVIEGTLESFYRDHVTPFAHDPAPPSLDLLIGVQRNGIAALFTTERSAARECRDRDNFAGVGSGLFLASAVLRQYYNWELDLPTAEILAALVLHRVKASIDGCGGQTEICRMHAEGVEFVNPQYVAALEQQFAELEQLERANFHYAVAGSPDHVGWMTEQLGRLQGKFSELQALRDGWWLPPQGPYDAAIR